MSSDDGLRTVGILGGMSSESTVSYYRAIDEGVREARGGHTDAELLIRSVNFGRIERYIREDRWDEARATLVEAAAALEAGGAAVVLLATNTMHRVAPAIEAALSVPFVHIVDVTARAVRAAGLETVGLLGTRTTMEADFYRDRLATHGLAVRVPEAPARAAVDRIIFEELTEGTVTDASRERYLTVIDELVAAGAEGVVLGCTEIGLLVEQEDRPEVPLLDTTALHVERAVDLALGAAPEPVADG